MLKKYKISLEIKKKYAGFSLVEVLVVIVVISILATLSTTVYAAVSGRASDSSVQADISNIVKKLMLYRADNGVYPAGSAQLATLNIKLAKSAYGNPYNNGTGDYNFLYCRMPATAPTTFALIAYSRSGNAFQYTNTSQLSKYTGLKTGTSSMCTSVGVSTTGAVSDRDWFYDNGQWQPYIGG